MGRPRLPFSSRSLPGAGLSHLSLFAQPWPCALRPLIPGPLVLTPAEPGTSACVHFYRKLASGFPGDLRTRQGGRVPWSSSFSRPPSAGYVGSSQGFDHQ